MLTSKIIRKYLRVEAAKKYQTGMSSEARNYWDVENMIPANLLCRLGTEGCLD